MPVPQHAGCGALNVSVLQKTVVPSKCLFSRCPGGVCSTANCGALDMSVLPQTVVPRMCLFYSRMCCTWTRLFNSSLHLLSRGVPGRLQLVLHLACLTTRACAVPLHLLLCWTWRALTKTQQKIEIMTRTKLLANFITVAMSLNQWRLFGVKPTRIQEIENLTL